MWLTPQFSWSVCFCVYSIHATPYGPCPVYLNSCAHGIGSLILTRWKPSAHMPSPIVRKALVFMRIWARGKWYSISCQGIALYNGRFFCRLVQVKRPITKYPYPYNSLHVDTLDSLKPSNIGQKLIYTVFHYLLAYLKYGFKEGSAKALFSYNPKSWKDLHNENRNKHFGHFRNCKKSNKD